MVRDSFNTYKRGHAGTTDAADSVTTAYTRDYAGINNAADSVTANYTRDCAAGINNGGDSVTYTSHYAYSGDEGKLLPLLLTIEVHIK